MTLDEALNSAINKLESLRNEDSNFVKIEVTIQRGTKNDGTADTYRPSYILSSKEID